MKTIKEICPIWTKLVEENGGKIPYNAEENGPPADFPKINGQLADIANLSCCFVGEARGGSCYVNSKYCEQCDDMSMQFFKLAKYGPGKDKYINKIIPTYEELVKKYEDHYNEHILMRISAHNFF